MLSRLLKDIIPDLAHGHATVSLIQVQDMQENGELVHNRVLERASEEVITKDPVLEQATKSHLLKVGFVEFLFGTYTHSLLAVIDYERITLVNRDGGGADR